MSEPKRDQVVEKLTIEQWDTLTRAMSILSREFTHAFIGLTVSHRIPVTPSELRGCVKALLLGPGDGVDAMTDPANPRAIPAATGSVPSINLSDLMNGIRPDEGAPMGYYTSPSSFPVEQPEE